MRILIGYAGTLGAAVALLAGCASSQATGPAPMVASSRATKATTSGDLLYASEGTSVLMLTYPKGDVVGTITNDVGQFLCADATNGNVFITSGPEIFEYAHGGTEPIATLNAPSSGYYFMGCAVDPGTGNLAVAAYNSNHKPNAVFLYVGAQGNPTLYTDSNAHEFTYCGYDDQGNLFIDGITGSNTLLLDELSNGGQELQEISVNLPNTSDGPVQWDGDYVTLENPRPPKIYQIAVAGSSGTVVGTTKLRNQKKTKSIPYALTWIQGGMVIAAAGPKNRRIGYWSYPAGGKPVRLLRNLTSKRNSFGPVLVSPGV